MNSECLQTKKQKKTCRVGLPSTFQGVHGTICYFLEANISEDLNLPPLFRTQPLIVYVAAPIRNNIWVRF